MCSAFTKSTVEGQSIAAKKDAEEKDKEEQAIKEKKRLAKKEAKEQKNKIVKEYPMAGIPNRSIKQSRRNTRR